MKAVEGSVSSVPRVFLFAWLLGRVELGRLPHSSRISIRTEGS